MSWNFATSVMQGNSFALPTGEAITPTAGMRHDGPASFEGAIGDRAPASLLGVEPLASNAALKRERLFTGSSAASAR